LQNLWRAKGTGNLGCSARRPPEAGSIWSGSLTGSEARRLRHGDEDRWPSSYGFTALPRAKFAPRATGETSDRESPQRRIKPLGSTRIRTSFQYSSCFENNAITSPSLLLINATDLALPSAKPPLKPRGACVPTMGLVRGHGLCFEAALHR